LPTWNAHSACGFSIAAETASRLQIMEKRSSNAASQLSTNSGKACGTLNSWLIPRRATSSFNATSRSQQRSFRRFSAVYPHVVLQVDHVATTTTMALPALRSRECDFILGRPHVPLADEDLNVESLFDDTLVVAAGTRNRLAQRRKIDLAELVDEPWILQAPHTGNYIRLNEAFQARGLAMPRAALVTLSLPLIIDFLANGPFITAYPRSGLVHGSLKVLPVDLPVRPWPVLITTLKNRTLSPVVERFIECAREVTKSFADRPRSRKSRLT
jgi:DNA-binding transcriptional LysR family regulator